MLVDAEDGERVALRGVVCSVCAVRTRQALESVPGVASVDVDLASSEARVRYVTGALPNEAALQRALDRVVVGVGIRRWIEHAAHSEWLRRWRLRGWRLWRSGT